MADSEIAGLDIDDLAKHVGDAFTNLGKQTSKSWFRGYRIYESIKCCAPEEGTPSIDQINARNAQLIPIGTQYLPSIKKRLVALVRLLDMANLRRFPRPDFQKTLEIISELSETVRLFRSAVHTITLTSPQVSKKEDHEFGMLKRHQTDELLEKSFCLVHALSDLFHDHACFVIGWNACRKDPETKRYGISYHRSTLIGTFKTIKQIAEMIQWSKKDDFLILQDWWRMSTNEIEGPMTKLIQRLSLTIRVARVSPQKICLQPHVLKVVYSTMPIVKIMRIFFTKLLPTPTSRPPFTISRQLCSFDIIAIGCAIHAVAQEMCNVVERLNSLLDNGSLNFAQEAKDRLTIALSDFDSAVEVLSLRLVPVDPQLSPPVSQNIFNDCFSLVVDQFRIAVQNFQNTVEAL
ncbi:hypothetical protein PtB15_9B210 [Puccinia triticina]|nr:hypothetical protein PtB15_9B210 [Puccinia triticina]